MEKIYGANERQDGLVKVGNNYYLYYGFGKDTENAEHGYNYRHKFGHNPTAEEIKEVVLSAIDAETREKITTGMMYDGLRVNLSVENQLNYSMFKDMLDQNSGSIIVKMTDADGNDKVVTFGRGTFDAFYEQVREHIKNCLQDCWREKAELDLGCYLP